MKHVGFFLAAGAALFFAGYFVRGYHDGSSIFSLNEDNAVHSDGKATDETAGSGAAVQRDADVQEKKQRAGAVASESVQVPEKTARTDAGIDNPSGQKAAASVAEQIAVGLRAGGAPEEDIKNIVRGMTARQEAAMPPAPAAEEPLFEEKSKEETSDEVAAGLRAGGAPEEDIENITKGMTGEHIADDAQMKTEIADRLRESGAPEEDIAVMTESLGKDEKNSDELQKTDK